MKHAILTLLALLALPLTALDIYEDTVWTPEESPYEFYEHVFVHEGATLTILPGTEVRFQSGYADAGDDFYATNGECVAKMMWVDGRVIAVGTEDEPILFTGTIDEPNHRWGTIYLAPESDHSTFLHCRFERAAFISWTPTDWYKGAIYCENGGDIRVEYCTFKNCSYSVYFDNVEEPQYLYDNTVLRTEQELFWMFQVNGYTFRNGNGWAPCTIAYNKFISTHGPFGSTSAPYGVRVFCDFIDIGYYLEDRIVPNTSSIYGCYFENSECSLGAYAPETDVTAYIRRNEVVASILSSGVSIGCSHGSIHIADNVLIESGYISTGEETNASIYNNLIIDGYGSKSMELLGSGSAWNNVMYNSPPIELGGNFDLFCNNTVLGHINAPVFYYLNFQTEIRNNILFTDREDFTSQQQSQYPLFRNNWLSHDISSLITDGGGNIIGDDPGLADPANGDFSLVEGSPCIDAGVSDSLWFGFDALNNFRIADGDSNGVAEVDMGAWESASSYRGCIEGYVFEEDGVTPLDITELELTGMLPEWSDSTGYFRFDCGPGEFTLTADHFYYDAQTVGTFTVDPGEIVFVDVTMTGCAVEDPEELLQPYILQSSNYPNPFNPTTTIRYSIPRSGHVELSVYNIRGQLVKRLVDEPLEAGLHEVVWNGRNERSQPVASGMYFYRLRSCGKSRTGKMLLMK